MSWFASIEDVPKDELQAAIEASDPLGLGAAAPGVAEQIAAAKHAATALLASSAVKGDTLTLNLGGHSDPGDTSTAADSICVELLQVRAPVEAAPDAAPEAPADPAAPTSETVSIPLSIDAAGGATAQLNYPVARLTVSQQPDSGTATLTEVEGSPDATTLTVVNATPDSTQTVVVAIAPAA